MAIRRLYRSIILHMFPFYHFKVNTPKNYLLPTTYYLLPTTYYLLPTTYYLLPITYYLLLITYYLLPASNKPHNSLEYPLLQKFVKI